MKWARSQPHISRSRTVWAYVWLIGKGATQHWPGAPNYAPILDHPRIPSRPQVMHGGTVTEG